MSRFRTPEPGRAGAVERLTRAIEGEVDHAAVRVLAMDVRAVLPAAEPAPQTLPIVQGRPLTWPRYAGCGFPFVPRTAATQAGDAE